MSSNQLPGNQAQASSDIFGFFGAATEYAIDAAQRTVLFWDVMRQRGNQYREHMAEAVPMCSVTKPSSSWTAARSSVR